MPLSTPALWQVGTAVTKRLLDVIVSGTALLLLSPALIAIAIAVRLESKGGSIFRQTRVGRYGVPFTILKFRTMAVDSDDSIHRDAIEKFWSGERLSDDPDAPYKLKKDPRVTKLGHFLRRTSLDELPQLVNVLRGDMSLVGPRPMIPYELEHFRSWHHQRHQVLPGITGLAQVTARGQVTMEEMLRLDVAYVHSQSLCGDFRLMLQTVPIVLKGVGAR